MPRIALVTNYSKDFAAPDQAAAATAIATGTRVTNGAICDRWRWETHTEHH